MCLVGASLNFKTSAVARHEKFIKVQVHNFRLAILILLQALFGWIDGY